jgi:hypothetical protein
MDTTPPDLPAVPTASSTPAVAPEVLEAVLIGGDLSGLTSQQRADYYGAVCRALGLNPLTKPFEYLTLNGKLRLYALRDCADQLRRIHGISITIVSRERLGDIYLVTARARDKSGREDESTGAVALGSLKGDALANALMKCETKAKRRVTLSLAGLGWLDETEIDTIPDARTGETPATPAPLPAGEGAPERRITRDEARELKKLAQHAFGYAAGERRLRADLGFETDESLTLRHLSAHVTVEQWQALMAAYESHLRQEVEADVP